MHTFSDYDKCGCQADREGWFIGYCAPEGNRPEIYAITDRVFMNTKNADQWARHYVQRLSGEGSEYHRDALDIVADGRRKAILRHVEEHQAYPDWAEFQCRDGLESNGFVHRKFGYPVITSLGELEIRSAMRAGMSRPLSWKNRRAS